MLLMLSLHVLSVSIRIYSGYSGFILQPIKHALGRLEKRNCPVDTVPQSIMGASKIQIQLEKFFFKIFV